MYFDEAIERINKIDWKKVDCKTRRDERNLGYEYLCRVAMFINEQKLNKRNPLFVNVAFELGYCSDKRYIDECNLEVQKALIGYPVPELNLNCYMQLADYADQNKEVVRYLQIYDPLIQLMELGFLYAYREGGFIIYGGGFYSLRGTWYERCLNASVQCIDNSNHMDNEMNNDVHNTKE